MMHSAIPSAPHDRDPLRPDDLPRKKIRKGTRSCWECKHRKVRCNFASDGDASCKECLARGTLCRSQDFPEPEKPRESDRTSLNDRMARVESMLEKLLLRVDSSDGFDQKTADATISPTTTPPTVVPLQDNAPMLSLFRNDKLEFRQTDTVSPSSSAALGQNNLESSNVCRQLIALVPPPSAIRLISDIGRGIWFVSQPKLFQDCLGPLNSNPVEDLSSRHPSAIAKTSMYIAVCLHILPAGFNVAALDLSSPPNAIVEKTLSLVSRWIIADDTIMLNLEGLETLSLFVHIWMMEGNLKSAWLSTRRILDVCQVLGFQRPPKSASEDDDHYRGVTVWRNALILDRLISLILGVYHSVPNVAVDRQTLDRSFASHNMTVMHITMIDHLIRISGSIIERNQAFSEVTSAMMEQTQRIDSELNLINPSLTTPDDGTSPPYIKLGLQMAFFQLSVWLHLPILVHSDPDPRYEYNRQTCLQSCRDFISCFISMRRLNRNTRQFRLFEFSALISTLTLIFGTLGYYGRHYQHPDNSFAVGSVISYLEECSKSDPTDKTTCRGFHILRTLREVAKGNNPPGYPPYDPNSTEEGRPSQITLDIPYFGTICLERRRLNDPPLQNFSTSLPSTTLPATDFGVQDPSSAWMGLVLDESSLAQSTNPHAWSGPSSVLDPNAEFWALNPDFTFQAQCMYFFSDDWGMGQ
ncbi:transcriptional regulator family: Fungal Specific TF [Penicillium nucicola]|uniref:transcriptional regulator family: Fungal Specific TF n=1 Tax=Penicillium nucicola TaxID=1850975 RepID=UPI0025456BB1|nr:transcriptional regulator family: Fungal Specific TF [Penicillium nucicola]KAJ5762258.1 transcriptional regulator family: Fungal Specific TF [Penicillium nucicola]